MLCVYFYAYLSMLIWIYRISVLVYRRGGHCKGLGTGSRGKSRHIEANFFVQKVDRLLCKLLCPCWGNIHRREASFASHFFFLVRASKGVATLHLWCHLLYSSQQHDALIWKTNYHNNNAEVAKELCVCLNGQMPLALGGSVRTFDASEQRQSTFSFAVLSSQATRPLSLVCLLVNW